MHMQITITLSQRSSGINLKWPMLCAKSQVSAAYRFMLRFLA